MHPLRPQVQAARRPQGPHGEVRQQVGLHRRRERGSRRRCRRRVDIVVVGGAAAFLPGAAELLLDILGPTPGRDAENAAS